MRPVQTAYQGCQAKPVCWADWVYSARPVFRAGLAYWVQPGKSEYLARWGREWVKLGPWDFLPGCLVCPECQVYLPPECQVCQVSLEFPVFPESPECRGFHLGLRQRIAR